MTADVLAHELRIPLHTIQVDRLVSQYLGETSTRLRRVFDFMKEELGVYFFYEFDSIGGDRGLSNEVVEMRRVLNSFFQFIEQDISDSIVIAATYCMKWYTKLMRQHIRRHCFTCARRPNQKYFTPVRQAV
jgi:SpoVK/Ycf46/Vps4 family AAA+-type ATPase